MAGRTATGIVLDTGTVQVVELAAEGESLAVRRVESQVLPDEAFSEGEMHDASIVADVIRRLVRHHKFSTRNICLAMGGRRSIARVIEIPGGSVSEAEHTLQDRIARYAIYEEHEVTWKASPLDLDTEGNRNYLAASASGREVDQLLPALRKAGLFVTHVEPLVLSTVRSLSLALGDESPPTVVVCLRNESTDFIIMRGSVPLLVRTVDEGSRQLAKRPQVFHDLLVEARRAASFCRDRFEDETPHLWLHVAATEWLEVVPALENELRDALEDIEVTAAQSLADIAPERFSSDVLTHPWTAVGAAAVPLGLTDDIPHLNLVPERWPRLQRAQRQLVGMAAAVAAAVLLGAGITTAIRLTAGDLAQQAEAARIRMQGGTTAVKTASELRKRAANHATRVQLWKSVRREVKPFDWVDGLEAVTKAVPEGIRVVEFEYRRRVLRLRGEALAADQVHQFVRNLSQLPQVVDPTAERLVREHGRGSERPSFTVTCRFRTAPSAAPQTPKPAREKKEGDS